MRQLSRTLFPVPEPITADFHRLPNGELRRGSLVVAQHCDARCDIYTPIESQRSSCPYVMAVCSGPHNHPDPVASKTPRPMRALFNNMLHDLDWQLADATPRRLMLNGSFMQRLKAELRWDDKRLPTLAHLHPSLGNHDHVAYLINCLRKAEYPDGTGFEGQSALADGK